MAEKGKDISRKESLQKVHIPKLDDMSSEDWEMSIINVLNFLMERKIFKAYTWEMEGGKNVRIYIWIKKDGVPILREYFSRGGCLEMKEGEVIQ